MKNAEGISTGQIDDLLRGSQEITFAGQGRQEVYDWITATLVEQEYFRLRKKQRGKVRALLAKLSGLSMPQITRLIGKYHADGEIRVESSSRQKFPVKYRVADLELLIAVDRAHQQLSAPATRRIIQREWHVFGKPEYANLAEISASHLQNLRNSVGYRQRAGEFTPTKPTVIAIGQRRRPDPRGNPGYLRIDSVHQGDWDGAKGVYHLNAVDEVTQWEALGCVPRITEEHVLPVVKAMLHQFPFRIWGLHSDNGSEFVNHPLFRMLEKLGVELTRSRPNRSSDNALVEGKNGAIVRKHMFYGHIPSQHADAIQRFYTAHFNVYLNYHRPCGFAQIHTDAQGRRQRHYAAADYATPYEKLRSLPDSQRHLKDGMRWELLDQIAYAVSDTEAAHRMTRAKAELLRRCMTESPTVPRC